MFLFIKRRQIRSNKIRIELEGQIKMEEKNT